MPIEGYEEFYKKINAKYDAELKQLNQQTNQETLQGQAGTSETTTPTTAVPDAPAGNGQGGETVIDVKAPEIQVIEDPNGQTPIINNETKQTQTEQQPAI